MAQVMPGIPTENGIGPHVNAHPEFRGAQTARGMKWFLTRIMCD